EYAQYVERLAGADFELSAALADIATRLPHLRHRVCWANTCEPARWASPGNPGDPPRRLGRRARRRQQLNLATSPDAASG
ncbi:hypothetical protein, partial [Pseudonocardia sp.]|uniref:hypothetical protein n=1 Tax=Pseudonocardia sp. TaxID=60912 RepID=UPI0031FE17A4